MATCRCYAYMEYVDETVVGAGDGTLDVIEVIERPAGVTTVLAAGATAAETDASGYVYVDVAQGTKVLFEGTWPSGEKKRAPVLVPALATYDVGAYLQ